MVNMRMTIQTKGVKGAPLALKEFMQNIEKVLGSRPLDQYIGTRVDEAKHEAPVRTGYLWSHIMSRRLSPTVVAMNSWAPYSGFVNFGTYRMMARPFFSTPIEHGPPLLAGALAEASMKYLRQVISKYQNGS